MSNEVYLWLSTLTTTQPLMQQWLTENTQASDPVKELYKNNQEQSTTSIWVWIIVALIFTLCCMVILILFGLGKIVAWKPNHGGNFSFWEASKKVGRVLTRRFQNHYTDANDIMSPYEEPVDIKLEEIHIYEAGHRVSEIPALSQKDKEKHERDSSLPNKMSSYMEQDCTQMSSFTTIDDSLLTKRQGSEKPKSFFQKFPLKCSQLTRTISFNGSSDETLETIKSFHGRPLPPLPTLCDIIKDRKKTPFCHSHVFLDKSTKRYGETKAKTDFEHLRNQLLNNSQEIVYLVDYNTRRKNIFSQFRKHTSTKSRPMKKKNHTILKRRSKSLDEQWLPHNDVIKYDQRFMRRSRSLDILEENITINKFYSELTNCSSPNIRGSQCYLKLPCEISSHSSTAEKEHIAMPSFNMRYQMENQLVTSKSDKHESMYAKIPEFLVASETLDLQKRPIPVPYELQHPLLLGSHGKEHIYQQASRIQSERTEGSNYGRHLMDQFASFRSISSGRSGQYAKIPESVVKNQDQNSHIITVDVRPGYKFI